DTHRREENRNSGETGEQRRVEAPPRPALANTLLHGSNVVQREVWIGVAYRAPKRGYQPRRVAGTRAHQHRARRVRELEIRRIEVRLHRALVERLVCYVANDADDLRGGVRPVEGAAAAEPYALPDGILAGKEA